MPARLLLSGPAGAGKTTSALVVGRTLVGPTGRLIVIDTEAQSALTIADEHTFDHLPWAPPYNPIELAETVNELAAEGVCIVIDSLSHFWTGEGGTLDIVDGKFGGWKVGTPAQNDLVDSLIRGPSHIIGCLREKVKYAVTEVVRDGRTRQVVEKLGEAPIQREGLDFEFNVAVSLDIHHVATIHKSRCAALPTGMTVKPHHMADFAVAYRDWLTSGEHTISTEQADALRDAIGSIPSEEDRVLVRKQFVEQFGCRPGDLLEHRAVEAAEWIAAKVAEHTPKVEGALADALSEAEQPALTEPDVEEKPAKAEKPARKAAT
jgi:hypothetical protein